MSLSEVIPLAIELPEEDRAKLMQELAGSMGFELVDLEVEKRRAEMNDPDNVLSSSELKDELQRLRDAR